MKSSKMIIWALAVLAVVALIVAVSRPAGGGDIGNEELVKLQTQGARLVDVRTKAEYEAGHIPGAELIPVDQVPSVAPGWDKSQAVIVYCATGSRSLTAADWLRANGFKQVYNHKAGMMGWNGRVTTGASAGSVAPSASGLPVMQFFHTEG